MNPQSLISVLKVLTIPKLAFMVLTFSAIWSNTNLAHAITPDFRPAEKRLLSKLYASEKKFGPVSQELLETLQELSQLYLASGRWDEYSSMRTRLLKITTANPSGPFRRPPGGPFPRIGLPNYNSLKVSPPTFLSHWLNKSAVPEFYNKVDDTFTNIVQQQQYVVSQAEETKQKGNLAAALNKLADIYSSHAQFSTASPLYSRAFLLVKSDSKELQLKKKVLESQQLLQELQDLQITQTKE